MIDVIMQQQKMMKTNEQVAEAAAGEPDGDDDVMSLVGLLSVLTVSVAEVDCVFFVQLFCPAAWSWRYWCPGLGLGP